jgi:nitrite reductase (NO-forming)
MAPRYAYRPAPSVPRDKPETLRAQIDRRIDERFDGETTRSSLAILLAAFAVLMAAVAAITIFFVAGDKDNGNAAPAAAAPASAMAATATPAADISAAAGKGIASEAYRRPDPSLPLPPPGAVKRFKVDVYEHVTKVSDTLAPTRVWSYSINGKENRGTGVSEPMVVTQGDKVEITLVNGGSKAMTVKMPHSIDFHSSEVAPNVAFKTIAPGQKHVIRFVAKHPGVFMYHCATAPVLMHTGAGMMGMMVVKPRNLAPVDRELWMTQQEYYLGKPGKDADMAKMQAKQPDVIAFNGYADQYKNHPVMVKRGERIRMYVLNAGPSEWSAFHVIGTVFDRAVVEGAVFHDSQTMNLAPSQGGWAEFTLDQEGSYPFVTHAFGDMVKGAAGALSTEHAPAMQMSH